ncbi:unnamed protein product [Dimorphilus gyrociliatus]|uniref:Uncharacterized protein n=1 Tax=Dimorphilus gyrociliatus TaxID=2664684 RepID=A0A7I8VN16_9ANNE|nr:unnamed protein product [Dimorphilus gyrociliatus]
MKTFSNILNPVVAFFTTEEDADKFLAIRNSKRKLPTIIKITDINRLRSFETVEDVESLFNKPYYPKYLPNTWDASYSCAMNAKYEFVNWASEINPYKTRYIAWLDIGLFRELVKINKSLCLGLPDDFDECKVSYGVVHQAQMFDNKKIFYHNLVWVAGGYFIANREIMKNWSQFYMEATGHLLAQGLSNTDQQVVYAIRNTLYKYNKTIPIKEHFWDGYRYNPWFFLAFKSRKDPGKCTIKNILNKAIVN